MHPRLVRLLEAGREALQNGYPSSLSGVIADARAFVIEQDEMFEALVVAVPQRGAAKEKIADVRALFREQRETIDAIELADGPGSLRLALERLETSIFPLLTALGDLDAVERQLPRQSPMPLINRLINIGINVREGILQPLVLRKNFGAVVRTVRNLQLNHQRFRSLHHLPPALQESWAEQFQRLQAGLGAIARYLETGADTALVDALKLLKFSSQVLMQRLAEMDEIARSEVRYSRIVALDELLAAADGLRAGLIESGVVCMAAECLRSLGGFYASALDTVATFPLAFALRQELDKLRSAMEDLQERAFPWMERLRTDPESAARDSDTLEELRVRFEAASAAHQNLQDALAASAEALRGAPQIEAVVEALGRLTSRSIPTWHVVDRVQHFLALREELVGQIDASDPGALAEMRAVLTEQARAVEGMVRYLDDRDERHLCDGFLRLCAIHPRCMEMQAALRTGAEAQKQARERAIPCLRCGARNISTSRFCIGCKAMLPLPAADETLYTDIVGGEEVVGMPANLLRLQSIQDRADCGEDLATLATEISAFRDQLRAVALDFDRGLGDRIKRGDNRVLTEFATSFRTLLDELLHGVTDMLVSAQNNHLDQMRRGYETALAAGQEMHETHKVFQEGLGVHT